MAFQRAALLNRVDMRATEMTADWLPLLKAKDIPARISHETYSVKMYGQVPESWLRDDSVFPVRGRPRN